MSSMYLLDFSVYKAPEELKMSYSKHKAMVLERVAANEPATEGGRTWTELYSPEKVEFVDKLLSRTGIDPEGTYLPPWLNPEYTNSPKTDMETALKEAHMVMGGAVSELLDKTGLKPTDIDILVTNCSIFCPTPSLASMLVNKYKMRTDIESYNLGGMGCGNGVMALSLLKNLLLARPNVNALFVPAEITTYCFYAGDLKDYLVANTLFRMGGAAILFTNKPNLARSAKYQLLHNVRVHTGADDESYGCMGWGPDGTVQKQAVNGVYLRKSIPMVAAKALELCLKQITPKIMTWQQYGEAAYHMYQKNVLGRPVGEYIPDFTQCADHFALHAGGYAVLKGLMKAMCLPLDKVLPSFAVLRDYGNTSCSTTWYGMAYHETAIGIKRGETVMQIGMGGGMKAGVNVWKALRDINSVHPAWAHRVNRPYIESELPRPVLNDKDREEIAANGGRMKPINLDAAIKASFAVPGKVTNEDVH
jgi:3-ketoacyl-CoA synthase